MGIYTKKTQNPQEPLDSPGALEKILDYLSRPGRAVAGGVRSVTDPKDNTNPLQRAFQNLSGERKDDFDAVLGDKGREEGTKRTVLGLVGDLVLDPLNLIGVGAVTKGIGKVAKPMLAAAENVKPIAKGLDIVKDTVRRRVNPTFMMDKEVERLSRLTSASHRSAPERVVAQMAATDPRMQNFSNLPIPDKVKLQEEVAKAVATQRNQERLKMMEEFFADPVNQKYIKPVEGGRFVSASNIEEAKDLFKVNPKLPWQAIDKDVVEALKLPKVSVGDRGKTIDYFMDKWRSGATKWNPRFHATNAAGNVYNMLLQGVNPAEAYKIGREGFLDGKSTFAGVDSQKIKDALSQFDVDKGMGHHITYRPDDMEATIKSLEEHVNPPKGMFKSLSRNIDKYIGDPVEKNARRGVVLEQIQKNAPKMQARIQELAQQFPGEAPQRLVEIAEKELIQDAVLMSKDTMFDYRELTPTMQELRRYMIPFATWAVKNTALQTKGLVHNPKIPALFAKTRNTVEREASEDKKSYIDADHRPDWLKDTGALQIPGSDKFIKNILPMTDLQNLGAFGLGVKPDAQQDAMKNVLGTMGPIPETVLEILQNLQSGTKRTIMDDRGFSTPVTANPLVQLIPEKIGGKFMDIAKNKVDPNVREYQLPYKYNMAMEQFPLVTSVGKSVQSLADPTNSKDDLAWLSWLGIPVTEQNRKFLEQTFKARNLEKKRNKGVQRNERKRIVKRASLFGDDE